ncbi:MAG: hypothetical protein GY853_14280 [PVC group bacterium]|nr:hypothetical protein [PVC group bacterium]
MSEHSPNKHKVKKKLTISKSSKLPACEESEEECYYLEPELMLLDGLAGKQVEFLVDVEGSLLSDEKTRKEAIAEILVEIAIGAYQNRMEAYRRFLVVNRGDIEAHEKLQRLRQSADKNLIYALQALLNMTKPPINVHIKQVNIADKQINITECSTSDLDKKKKKECEGGEGEGETYKS